jgi:putative flavoprotein involved in K+ transport
VTGTEEIDTVVIGGGQAGLCVGYHLAKAGRPFVILDAGSRTGDAWRQRWDSLRLFTPARFDALPGLPFPARGGAAVSKDAMADYLEGYAERFALPVRHGVKVSRLSRHRGGFLVSAGDVRIQAANVVVAMANSQQPWIPPFAAELDPSITALHSKDYRNPAQLRPGRVLVVGAGNSGGEIALELARTHSTLLAGKETGSVPFRIDTFVARHLLVRLVRFVGHHVLCVRTPMGRKARPAMLTRAVPLVRVKPADLLAAGVERVGRVTGVQQGLPVVDGQPVEVDTIVWCTGYRPGFSWIDLPILGDRQEPAHAGGIVASEPGLYFVGLHFLYSVTSEAVTGVDRDARRVVRHLLARAATETPAPAAAAVS